MYTNIHKYRDYLSWDTHFSVVSSKGYMFSLLVLEYWKMYTYRLIVKIVEWSLHIKLWYYNIYSARLVIGRSRDNLFYGPYDCNKTDFKKRLKWKLVEYLFNF